jgi:hypothetical protein
VGSSDVQVSDIIVDMSNSVRNQIARFFADLWGYTKTLCESDWEPSFLPEDLSEESPESLVPGNPQIGHTIAANVIQPIMLGDDTPYSSLDNLYFHLRDQNLLSFIPYLRDALVMYISDQGLENLDIDELWEIDSTLIWLGARMFPAMRDKVVAELCNLSEGMDTIVRNMADRFREFEELKVCDENSVLAEEISSAEGIEGATIWSLPSRDAKELYLWMMQYVATWILDDFQRGILYTINDSREEGNELEDLYDYWVNIIIKNHNQEDIHHIVRYAELDRPISGTIPYSYNHGAGYEVGHIEYENLGEYVMGRLCTGIYEAAKRKSIKPRKSFRSVKQFVKDYTPSRMNYFEEVPNRLDGAGN